MNTTTILTNSGDDLVIDWRKKQQAKARVRDHIQDVLDSLPESYDSTTWNNGLMLFTNMCTRLIEVKLRVFTIDSSIDQPRKQRTTN